MNVTARLTLAVALLAVAAPAVVTANLTRLTQIDRFASLPAPVRAGAFTVDGTSAAGWKMAEPGGAFSATDVPVQGAPGRRLVFAACDAQLCIIHYERGGIAHFYEILALQSTSKRWMTVWNVRGAKPIPSLDALRAALRNGTLGESWSAQSAKGDF